MKVLAFDIEADNLLPGVTKVWCGATTDIHTGETRGYGPDELPQFVEALRAADRLVGHNAVSYDRPALEKVLGVSGLPPVIDTMLMSMLVYPDRGSNPIKGHSLKAWGDALKCPKGDHTDWTQYTPKMLEYCKQDTVVTAKIFNYLQGFLQGKAEAVRLEHQFAAIIQKQVANGFCLDKDAVDRLRERLHKDRAEAMAGLMHIPPWQETVELKSRFWRDPETGSLYETKAGAPKEIQKRLLRDGPQITRTKEVPFNPASGDHKARLFMEKYGWVPKKLTESGKPAVDRDVLKTLPYPEAQILSKISVIDKVQSTYVDAWTTYERGGRVHGEVITNGTVTGRCSHHSPNMNCPKVKSGKDKKPIFGFDGKYGADCRSCFTARDGWALVGCDASGLEARMLAHFVAQWDGGAFGQEILLQDIHTVNQKMAGLASRDEAKTFYYKFVYGGRTDPVVEAKFYAACPSLKSLKDWVKSEVKTKGSLKGLDDRILPIRSDHSALNTLLQSAGAVVMKKALCFFYESVESEIGPHGERWALSANVHDEFQTECVPEIAERVGQLAVDAIRRAGEYFNLRIRLDGEYKIGKSWFDTH